ncbi:DUF4328 domain-containing protein [Kitasatospora sp. NPDC093558]|uniref:DUF4328 domain-containing protein n=1 Tax=Kitasatospora sp. NPDC093558 TaxID=3155201 RepID=UPI003449751E
MEAETGGRIVDPGRLAVTLQVLVAVETVVQLGVGLAGGSRSSAFPALVPVLLPLIVATAVVFVRWFHRVRVNAGVFAPEAHRHSAGFAIGGWFIPFAMWWIPRKVALDTWRASGPAGGTWVVNAWWAAWLAKTVGSAIVSRVGHYPGGYSPFDQVTVVVLGVLAILFVRQLTERQKAQAEFGA